HSQHHPGRLFRDPRPEGGRRRSRLFRGNALPEAPERGFQRYCTSLELGDAREDTGGGPARVLQGEKGRRRAAAGGIGDSTRFFSGAWPSGKAAAFGAAIVGSNPTAPAR